MKIWNNVRGHNFTTKDLRDAGFVQEPKEDGTYAETINWKNVRGIIYDKQSLIDAGFSTDDAEGILQWDNVRGNIYDAEVLVEAGFKQGTAVEQIETGTNIPPTGAKCLTVKEVYGNSTQEVDPSPDYPQEIQSVEELNFKVASKNLIDLNHFKNFANWSTSSHTGSGDDAATNIYNKGYDLPCEAGKTYTISKPSTYTKYFLYLCKENADGTTARICYLTTSSNIFNTYTFSVAEGEKIYLRSGSTSTRTEFNNSIGSIDWIQLEYGTTATPYVPYTETTHTITPPRGMNKVGDYTDILDAAAGEWKWNTEREDVLLDKQTYLTSHGYRFLGYPTTQHFIGHIGNVMIWCDKGTYNPSAGVNIDSPDGIRYATNSGSKGTIVYQYESDSDEIIVNVIYPVSTYTEPINPADLIFLQSIKGLLASNTITITDQNGKDVSYLVKYII